MAQRVASGPAVGWRLIAVELWLLGLLLAVTAGEVALSRTWNRAYFSTGIPVFRRVQLAFNLNREIPSAHNLEAALNESSFFPPLVFRLLTTDRLGFREQWEQGLGIDYTPVMHGHVRFSRESASVEVVGLLNWFAVAFVGFVAFVVVNKAGLGVGLAILLLPIGLFGLIYRIQARRFRQVAEAAAAEWSGAGAHRQLK